MSIKPLLLALAIGAISGCATTVSPSTNWSQQPLAAVQQAAVQGDAGAQFSLATRYYQGQGVPQNYQQAASWYLKAAKQGNAQAKFNLGVMYANGQGAPQDHQQAFDWY
ncbi:MAG: tetratricopeptide repeat protein, partial [Aeromonas sp.]